MKMKNSKYVSDNVTNALGKGYKTMSSSLDVPAVLVQL